MSTPMRLQYVLLLKRSPEGFNLKWLMIKNLWITFITAGSPSRQLSLSKIPRRSQQRDQKLSQKNQNPAKTLLRKREHRGQGLPRCPLCLKDLPQPQSPPPQGGPRRHRWDPTRHLQAWWRQRLQPLLATDQILNHRLKGHAQFHQLVHIVAAACHLLC